MPLSLQEILGSGENLIFSRYRGGAPEGVTVSKYTLEVVGMTCDHCVQAVTKEVGALAEVTDVAITLDTTGPSTVTVNATAAISADSLRQAVRDAGYETVGEISGL